MAALRSGAAANLKINSLLRKVCAGFKAPEHLSVSEWADKYRKLQAENSAESGQYKTNRTPYLKEIMDAFTDDRVTALVVVASSQVGKTEMLLNLLGYIIDQDPGPALFIQPKKDLVEDFSKRRLEPMIRGTECLAAKISKRKSRDTENTILQKSYPGGTLTLMGTNVPEDLAGIPARYILGDEVDRWTRSAGTEGDPWGLLEARTTTFYNRKMVAVSTPVTKGHSKIEELFDQGTREYWCVECPECGEWTFPRFDNIRFEHTSKEIGSKKQFFVKNIRWACPACGAERSEPDMKKLPHKWVAESPDAIKNGTRSFWINGFASPWMPWERIILRFLEAEGDPRKLKVVFNTMFGELWEERGDVPDEDTVAARAEDYGAELPDGVLCLTMGVDTQDNRFEYEVVGYGFFGETWGIEKGFIMGRPDNNETWDKLDAVRRRLWSFGSGKKLKVSMTFIDTGGHFARNVREKCAERVFERVFVCMGSNQENDPFTSPRRKLEYEVTAPDGRKYKKTCGYYRIGVSAGKEHIMSALKVQEPGARYCHFPRGRGYDSLFYKGLLSEAYTYDEKKQKYVWKVLEGHKRNEALDCRNYANAAFDVLRPNLDRIKQLLDGKEMAGRTAPKKRQQRRMRMDTGDAWA